MIRQLPLPFPHRAQYAPDSFLPALSNQEALTWLDRVTDWPDQRLALWGEAGGGKTHLLHIFAQRRGATLLSGRDLVGIPPPPNPAGMAVDLADAPAEESALLHLLNACREAAVPILLAASQPPARWPVRLPDLASRLRAIVTVEIRRPDDALLRDLLTRLLEDRQLMVSPGLRDWLLLRLPRSPAALQEAVSRLDSAALAAGGGITRPLAAEVLCLQGRLPGFPPDDHDVSETPSEPGLGGDDFRVRFTQQGS